MRSDAKRLSTSVFVVVLASALLAQPAAAKLPPHTLLLSSDHIQAGRSVRVFVHTRSVRGIPKRLPCDVQVIVSTGTLVRWAEGKCIPLHRESRHVWRGTVRISTPGDYMIRSLAAQAFSPRYPTPIELRVTSPPARGA